MTISTTSASQIISGDGITTTFQFGFIGDSASDVTVTSISSSGTQTILNPSQYTLLINPPNPNQLWGIGGTITYPLSGSAIPAGQQLLIQRTLPLTQPTTVRNQGNYYAQVTEQALDTLCMEIQQVAARTGQMRGTWATNIAYNFGDVVVDGANGANTGNYYMCAVSNTSGTWTTDLAAGDWSLVINIQNINKVVGAYLPLIGGTISGNLTVGGTINPSGGFTAQSVTSSALASNAVTNAILAQVATNTVKGNNLGNTADVTDISIGTNALLGRGTANITPITLGTNLSISGSTLNGPVTSTFANIGKVTAPMVAASSGITVAHGLSTTPKITFGSLQCVTAEGAWASGDIASSLVGGKYDNNFAASAPHWMGWVCYADATNVYMRVGDVAVSIPRKDTGVAFPITTGNWNAILTYFY